MFITVAGLATLAGCGVSARHPESAHPLPAASLRYMHMISTTSGWAATAHRVLRTMDGGRTWLHVTPVASPHKYPHLWPVWVNRSTAFVVVDRPHSAALMRTTNGGKSWQMTGSFPVRLTRSLYGLPEFLSAQVGWFVPKSIGAAGTTLIQLDRTTDGGGHWSPVFSDITQNLGGGAGDVSAITFVSPEHGWMTGSASATGQVYFEETENGGGSWLHQALPVPASLSQTQWNQNLILTGAPQFFGSSHEDGVLPVDIGDLLWIYHTTDGGTRWRPVPFSAHPPPGTAQSAIDFITPGMGWVWTSQYSAAGMRQWLWQTRNGGQTWRILNTGTGSGTMEEMDFVSRNTGWALMQKPHVHGARWSLWKTVDGGQRWSQEVPQLERSAVISR